MRYENLLSRALRITWRRPWLWLLALLAGEANGAGGGGGSSGSSFQQPTANGANGANGANFTPPDLGWVPGWLTGHAALLLGIAAAVLVIGLLLFLLSCLAEGALIRAVAVAAGVAAGKAAHHGRDVGEGPELAVGAEARARHPAPELLPGAAVEGAAGVELGGTGRLPDQEEARRCRAGEGRAGLGEQPIGDAARAGAGLGLQRFEAAPKVVHG